MCQIFFHSLPDSTEPFFSQWLASQSEEIKNTYSLLNKPFQNKLFSAIECHFYDFFLWLDANEYVIDLSFENFSEGTALHKAASSGSVNIMEWLLNKGLNLQEKPLLPTYLDFAVRSGKVEMAEYLVVDHLKPIKSSYLITAAEKTHVEMTSWLLKHNCDVNVNEKGMTPLFALPIHDSEPRAKCEAIARALISHKADLKISIGDQTFLGNLIESSWHPRLITLLVEKINDIDYLESFIPLVDEQPFHIQKAFYEPFIQKTSVSMSFSPLPKPC